MGVEIDIAFQIVILFSILGDKQFRRPDRWLLLLAWVGVEPIQILAE